MTTADLAGLLLCSLLGLALLISPGALIAKALARIDPTTNWRSFSPALGIAMFPLLDACIIRLSGVMLALEIRVVLLAATIAWARDYVPRVSRITVGGMALWWVYLACVYVDIDFGKSLYQPITVLDLVKHAAVVREIEMRGIPLHDPFFARDVAAGYYHYFYDGAAILDIATGHLADSRMSFVGGAFVAGVAMASFIRALVVDLGWQETNDRRLTCLVILVCSLGGFDLIGLAGRWALTGFLEPNAEWWDEEISFLPTAGSWVPHHLAGVMACFVALHLFAKALNASAKARLWLTATAGIAMANAFGLSIWVTVGSIGVLAAAPCAVPARQRARWMVLVGLAGAFALILSAPQILDLVQGRANVGPPISLWIREPARIGETFGISNPLVSLLLTPLTLILEFGPFVLGTWLFHRDARWERNTVLARLLIASFSVGLTMNLLVRSTIINNDFGWRVAWFAQLPAILWTVAAFQRPATGAAWRTCIQAAMSLGAAATLYNALAARIVRPPLARHPFDYINDNPQADFAMAKAYHWAAQNIDSNDVLQHNPLTAPRIFDFGLYGVHRVAVADSQAALFGAAADDVADRIKLYGGIFSGRLDPGLSGRVHLVVTSRDPLWQRLSAGECLYRSSEVCITKEIGQ